jgi:multicomponent Na+:H+ antiporter subunit C
MAQIVTAGFVGLMFAAGTYLMLKRNMLKLIWGTLLFSQAANVYLITMGSFSGGAPVLNHGGHGSGTATDPLVQAMVLTAIVIGFGTTAFGLVLALRVYEEHGTLDLKKIGGGDD